GKETPPGAAEDGGPVVEGSRRRVGRGKLRQARRDGQSHHRHERPTKAHHQRTSVLEPVAVERHRAGENGDDGKRQREVGKAAHLSQHLLYVAEPVELLRVPFSLLPASGGPQEVQRISSSRNR